MTPDRLDEGTIPRAVGGYAVDTYVEMDDGEVVVGGTGEPTDLDPESLLDLNDEAAE